MPKNCLIIKNNQIEGLEKSLKNLEMQKINWQNLKQICVPQNCNLNLNLQIVNCDNLQITFWQQKSSKLALFLQMKHCQNLNLQLQIIQLEDDCISKIGTKMNLQKDVLSLQIKVEHQGKNGLSEQLIKTVLDKNSHLNLTSEICIKKNAQANQAILKNKNLLLDAQSSLKTEPILRISNPDSNCRHGATISHPKQEDLEYLFGRNLNEKQAKKMVVRSFLSD